MNGMFGRIWNLAVKEWIQLKRDRLMTGFLLVFPVAQLVLLAVATGHGVRNLSLAVVDLDRSVQSRALIQALDNTPELDWRYQPADQGELAAQIEDGRAAVGVVVPAGFGAALIDSGATSALQVIVDGSNTAVARTGQSTVEAVLADFLRRQAAARGASIRLPPVQLRSEVRFNPDLNSRLFTIPAQMGFIVYQVTLAVASLAFARERELGTLEALLVTPLRRFELISGKAVLAWLLGGLDFVLMYLVVTRLFAVPMRGSFVLLLGCSFFFIAVEISFGVIISSFARTQQQAILYVFMLAMLDVTLSGYLVPVKNMPALFRAVAEASPLQHYLVIIRAIMLKGASLSVIGAQVGALGAIGAAAGIVALRTATRSLE